MKICSKILLIIKMTLNKKLAIKNQWIAYQLPGTFLEQLKQLKWLKMHQQVKEEI